MTIAVKYAIFAMLATAAGTAGQDLALYRVAGALPVSRLARVAAGLTVRDSHGGTGAQGAGGLPRYHPDKRTVFRRRECRWS